VDGELPRRYIGKDSREDDEKEYRREADEEIGHRELVAQAP
jgi:hypothetical protein